ncbi:MAG: radical SAM protein [Panacibacter sp.]
MLKQKTIKSVLNKHKKRDSWFLDEYSVNPYEGCSCNCLYCYVRGSKYGENMEDGLAVKENISAVLEKQLQSRANKKQYGIVAVGSSTDAYMPHEETLRMTQKVLQLLLKYRFPVFISTKRSLITRDIDLLKKIDTVAILPEDLQQRLNRGVVLSVSLSTMNECIAGIIEPGAIKPLERLQLVKRLKEAGFLVGVNAIPLLPFISDTENEMEKIIASAKEYGADYILTGSLTLFGSEKANSKTLYYKFLERYDASMRPKYDQLFGNNFYVPFQYQNELKQKAVRLCIKYNIRNSLLS